MRRFPCLVLLLALVVVGPAFAGDDPRVRLAALDDQRDYYEQMLRDAETETAALYFVARLEALRKQHARSSTGRLVPRRTRRPGPQAADA